MTLEEIRALDAQAYLTPEMFTTELDEVTPNLAEERFREGLRIALQWHVIVLAADGTWYVAGARTHNPIQPRGVNRAVIGRDMHSASLLRGFLAGTADIMVARIGKVSKIIKTGNHDDGI